VNTRGISENAIHLINLTKNEFFKEKKKKQNAKEKKISKIKSNSKTNHKIIIVM